MLRFTVEVLRQPRVSDETFDLVRTCLSDRELVEVLQAVGYYWSFGPIATVLDVEVTKVRSDEPVLDSGGTATG